MIDLTRAEWHKSTCSGSGDNCVEVAVNLRGVVAVRDSEDPEGPKLVFACSDWKAFVAGIRAGRFDFA